MTAQAFASTLDAAQEYLALQEALAAALRAGFLSLAQARYSMGADRVSALQLPTHMAATARLRADGGGQLELVQAPAKQASPPASRSGSGSTGAPAVPPQVPGPATPATAKGTAAAQPAAQPAAAAAAAAPEAVAGAEGAAAEGLEAALQRMRLAAQQSDSIVDQLAAKYCGGGNAASAGAPAAGGGELDGEYEEVAQPGRPLHWFGSLVAPSLRDAEGHFQRALQLAVEAANAQGRLRRGLEQYQASGGAAAAAAAQPS